MSKMQADTSGIGKFVTLTGNQSIAGDKTFTNDIISFLPDSAPGIPIANADGVYRVVGGDGSKHLIFFCDDDGDGKYDSDIRFLNNGYVAADNAIHIRPGYVQGGIEQGRLVLNATYDATLGIATNYIQSGRNFSGTTQADLAITRYNSDFRWVLFDESQNGYAGFGLTGGATPDSALARVHAKDGSSTVGLFQSTAVGGTGRVGFMDINTTSGTAVTLGAFGDEMIGRASGTNIFRASSVGLYTGGNVTPTAHLHVAGSTTSSSAIRIASGTAPTSPNDGDLWYDGTNVNFRNGSTTYIIPYDALVAHLAGTETFTGIKTFAPTNNISAFIVANSGITTHILRADSTNGRIGINLGSATALNSTLAVNGSSVFGGGATTATALADIQASTTSRSSARIRSGVAPTSPNDGDLWQDGTHLYSYINGATRQLDQQISTGITRSISTISTPTTAGSTAGTDYVYFVSGTTTLTLSTAVSNTNKYTIKNTGSNTVTVATTSAQTIDGSSTAILTPNTSLDLISDNSNWRIV